MPPLEGCAEPRISTEPLRTLTPKTSLGFECIRFAEEFLRDPLLPWQKEWLIRALEVDANGQFRYRTVVTTIARQNGKTHLLKVLAAFMMFTGRVRLVLGVAQTMTIAIESWQGVVDFAYDDRDLAAEVDRVRQMSGAHNLTLRNGARYLTGAANGRAGRGLSVDLLILDELRTHRDWKAWSALSKTTIARPNALIVGISNAGDESSVVLNSLRDSALAGTDDSLGIFEWSAPESCELDDREAWAQANPGLGHTVTERAIASALGTDPPAVFRTEVLNQRVDSLDGAIDVGAWSTLGDGHATMDALRDRIALCIDVSLDQQHVTLYAAGQTNEGRIRIEPVGAWDSIKAARAVLPDLIEQVKPRVVGWFPGGPAAALAADLRGITKAQEIKASDVPAACQGFAEQIVAREIVHSDDPLLNAQIKHTQKLYVGDGWRFTRRGAGQHCDAVYAAAGAVHLARTLPPSVGRPRIITAA